MAPLQNTFTRAFAVTCKCGQEIEGKIWLSGVTFAQHSLESMQIDTSNATATATYEGGITHCPGCGITLPMESSKG